MGYYTIHLISDEGKLIEVTGTCQDSTEARIIYQNYRPAPGLQRVRMKYQGPL